MDSDSATLKLTATDTREIIINDNIDGVLGYKVNIGGDSTGFVNCLAILTMQTLRYQIQILDF